MTDSPTANLDAHRRPAQGKDHNRLERWGHAWKKQALSAKGFKRVGRHSEYAIYTVWSCVRRGTGGSSEPPGPPISFSLGHTGHRRRHGAGRRPPAHRDLERGGRVGVRAPAKVHAAAELRLGSPPPPPPVPPAVRSVPFHAPLCLVRRTTNGTYRGPV
jgi:hypothetical protein